MWIVYLFIGVLVVASAIVGVCLVLLMDIGGGRAERDARKAARS